MNKAYALLFAICLAATLPACSQSTGVTQKQAEETITPIPPPATVSFFINSGALNMDDNEFQTLVADPVKKQFPSITMQYLKADSIDNLIAAGTPPDIIWAAPGDFGKMNQLQLFTDLNPLIQKYQFDLNRLEPDVLKSIKALSANGEVLYLPSYIKSAALYYNKDLFDKFGVSYPKDGMTWEEAQELSKKMTRLDGQTQYIGFDFNNGFFMNNNQLSAPFVDPKTNKSLLNSEKWKVWFDTMKGLYQGGVLTKSRSVSFLDGNVAMYADQSIIDQLNDPAKTRFNWDMVTLPSFPQAPDVGIQLNSPAYIIPPSSKVREQAFQAITALLTDEYQTQQARSGKDTVLKNPDIKKQLGSDFKSLADKNMAALYKNHIAESAPVTPYDATARGTLIKKFDDVINGKDVNTALREADEEVNQKLAASK